MTGEMVLVIPSKDVDELIPNTGFINIPIEKIKELTERNGFFVKRERAESDESIRQIIPYVVMRNLDDLYLLVRRLSSQTEKRLHGMYSIGIGGHVNDQDEGETPWMKFLSGMEREMNEEVIIKNSVGWPKYLGVIKESTTPVNRVHLGVVFQIKAEIEGIREKDKFVWEFANLADLLSKYDLMESWSKYVIDMLNT
ncbi:DNA mismatch repair protein MutT [Athalassotoga saccharophila]|uniref:DNA mismatch repair protein MutT n=1 Tax=Athalassotoga saccharophila TaxID=1441386 RepID=UPI0013794D63|nr:DNA mismatch repair protein MutT [Athalassotoga saccharophila]BBJ27353.1 nudix hydrolase [Athalassotoga saccharophila]